jgi:FtsH-binding integral membrane protein
MKYLILIISFLFILMSISSLNKYGSDYKILSEYGKGYFWGNILLLTIGIILLFFGLRKFRKNK